MKGLISSFAVLVLVSCAHKHGEKSHHHHNSKEEISAEDHGDGRYMIKDSGETYYFDTEKAFLEFEKEINAREKRPKCTRRGRQLVCGG
jgi:YHS domain-containing protein